MTAAPAQRGVDAVRLLGADPAQRPPYRLLLTEAWSVAAYWPALPDPATLPDGNGQHVLVIPAFLATDLLAAGLRAFLRQCGFQPHRWGLGVNWGPTPRILDRLLRRLDLLTRDGPIGLVGVSMGGVLARNLACERPSAVSHVVSICSPFRLPVPTTIGPLVRLCAPHYCGTTDLDRLRQPLPVPSTMICSRDDGIVAPAHCWTDQPGAKVVEVSGSHISICRNPAVLRTVVQELAGDIRGPGCAVAPSAAGRMPRSPATRL